jgi:hypothetical protein
MLMMKAAVRRFSIVILVFNIYYFIPYIMPAASVL